MKHPRHHVTDHALLRYFERVEGVDVEACRRALGRKVDDACEGHEGMSAVIIDGMRFVIESDNVVTVHRRSNPRRAPRNGKKKAGTNG